MKNLFATAFIILALLSFSGCPAASTVTAPDDGTGPPAQPGSTVATPVILATVDESGLCEALTISCATPGAAISYSLDDGSTWQPYDGTVTVYRASSIKAGATADGYADSGIAFAEGFQPRALFVPFVFFKGQYAMIRSEATVIYSTSNYYGTEYRPGGGGDVWAPGTWKVYGGPIDLSKARILAVQCGSSSEGHSLPVTLPDGLSVTFMPVTVSLAQDWSSYETDLWMEFSQPVKGSVKRNGETCSLEQPAEGNDLLYFLRDASPGTYEITTQAADKLFFRFQYVSGDATVESKSAGGAGETE